MQTKLLQFTENKRKREVKAEEKETQNELDKQVRKPAWKDKHTDKISVSIEDVSRLRKLKKEEGETKIKETDAYIGTTESECVSILDPI